MPAKKSHAMLMGSVLLLGSSQLMAAPSASMLANTCAGCHGTNGVSTGPAAPTIAGKSAEYIKEVMEYYKDGSRHSTIMGRIAKGYSDEEVALMADYYAKQKFVSAAPKQKLDADKIKAGKKVYKKNCAKCHDENGRLPDDDSGILGGQWLPYLQYTMQDYRDGRQEMTKKMKKKVDKLDDAQIEAVLQFFASQD
ncbi:MAG: cytochrome c4 [Thiotrichales bacterium]|nr:MAG: cytochrome c4 [Thiotrichales bacterium]